MENFITGIQQCGIGTTDAVAAAQFYKTLFGMDTLVFDDTAEAVLMKAYTGNIIEKRKAMLTMNLMGGGGFELWQFTGRQAQCSAKPPRLGDLGIYAIKIKCPDVLKAFKYFMTAQGCSISPLLKNPNGQYHFWLQDKYGHIFNMVKADEFFEKSGKICGGVCGAVIGVSDMPNSLRFYKDFLGIDHENYNVHSSGVGPVSYNDEIFHSVLLTKKKADEGAFSQLLGGIHIELIEAKSYRGTKIFANRFWGDIGFIHLCFDVLDMMSLKNKATQYVYHFTVDSQTSFAMEKAGGRFCYVEDPDGTLIELVETHAVPILKKAGWYLNLKKRKKNKPLPYWMIKVMGFNKLR
jgi:catechol 2,3-dioxygenase-like lactoylglutathione lyase family enzyme